MPENIKKLLLPLVLFCAGIFVGANCFPREIETKIIEKPTIVQGETKTITETRIAYVPKEENEKTDIDAEIGKQSVSVKLNGKEIDFAKADDEEYIFDKNKIALTHTAAISFNAKVEPTVINKTKHWGIGGGYGSDGVAGLITFPVNKKAGTDGWLYMTKDTKTGGVIIRF